MKKPLLILLLLSACHMPTEQELAQADKKQCEGYGFKQNTDAYSKCLMDLDMKRKQDEQDNWNTAMDAIQRQNEQTQRNISDTNQQIYDRALSRSR